MEYRKEIDNSIELAKWYDEKYTEMGDGWATPLSECVEHLNDLGVSFDKSKTLLDVGCGAGHFIAEAEKRVTCYGMDISARVVDYARKRCSSKIYHYSIETSWDEDTYDYVVSLGSLEHVVDLDGALDNIRHILKDDGQFYFLCPNEKWKHFDQPNERTMTDEEWEGLFVRHGLFVHSMKRWNDSTVFIGSKTAYALPVTLPPQGDKLNIGSGQRRCDTASGWVNIDCVSRPGQVPDLVCDVGKEPLPYADNTMEVAVLHQVLEHFGLGEGQGLIREIYRSLKPGGSLIITVPDMRALAERWIAHQIDDYIYFVNLYGAFQGEEGDRHRWGFSRSSLMAELQGVCPWSQVKLFDWRPIHGADIARDFWVLGMEAIK